MATDEKDLFVAAAVFPDGTASNLLPALRRKKSSAGAPTPYWMEAAFDAGQTEQLMWQFKMPDNYASAPILQAFYKMASATSGNVRLEGRIAAITPDVDSEDMDAIAFDSANNVTDTVPATTAGKVALAEITLTNADSLAAGDLVVVYFARLGGDGADTAAGDLELVHAVLKYTKS